MSDREESPNNNYSEAQTIPSQILDKRNTYIGDGITLSLTVTDLLGLLGLLEKIFREIPIVSGFVKLALRGIRTLAYLIRWRMNLGRQDVDAESRIASIARMKNDKGWFTLNMLGLTLTIVGLLLSGPFAFLLGSCLNDLLELYEEITDSIDQTGTGGAYFWDVYRDFNRDDQQRTLFATSSPNNPSDKVSLISKIGNPTLFAWQDQRTKVNLGCNATLAIGKIGIAALTITAIALGAFPPALIITGIILFSIILIARVISFTYQKKHPKPSDPSSAKRMNPSMEENTQRKQLEQPLILQKNQAPLVRSQSLPTISSSSLKNKAKSVMFTRSKSSPALFKPSIIRTQSLPTINSTSLKNKIKAGALNRVKSSPALFKPSNVKITKIYFPTDNKIAHAENQKKPCR